MIDISQIFHKLFTRRRDQRFTVFSDTFVTLSPAISPGGERKVRIADISNSGAVFIYSSSFQFDRYGFVKLSEGWPDSRKIRYETVDDVQIAGASQTEAPYWRKSVKFTGMDAASKSALKQFIKDFSMSQK